MPESSAISEPLRANSESDKVLMAAEVSREILSEEEEYADAEYRRFLKDKYNYIDFNEFLPLRRILEKTEVVAPLSAQATV